ncbi:MAG: hypothetical protein ACWGHO_04155 [Candidatus Moraniibacteriota bacterium]
MNKMKYFFKRIINYLRVKRLERSRLVIVLVFALGVAVGGHFFAYAENFIDSFLDTSRVANTWNVEVDTANGEVKLAQRSCDNTVWFCDLTYLCPSLAGDGSQLLVKRTTETSVYQWKTYRTACDTPQCGIDGGQNGDSLVPDSTVDFTFYPAQKACNNLGGRLPTFAELQCIYSHRTLFGNNFVDNASWFVSSEEEDVSSPRVIDFGGGYSGYHYKDYNIFYVRCVRGW